MQDMQDCIAYYRSGCKSKKLSERTIINLSTWIDTYLDVMKVPQGNKGPLPDIEIYNNRFKEILMDNYHSE